MDDIAVSSLNKGTNKNDVNGWLWEPVNSGKVLSFPSGVATGRRKWISDYFNVDAKSGRMDLYWNSLKDVAKDEDPVLRRQWRSDGLADYVWTQSVDDAVRVWLNQYPKAGAIVAWLNSCAEDDLAPELILIDTPPWATEPPVVCDDWFGNIDKRVTDGFNDQKLGKDDYNHKVRYRVQWRKGCKTELNGRKDMDVLNPVEDYSVRWRNAFQMPWEYST
ncbi:uncharacterized protein NECHADRAFT_87986 [Fusarium vanettenii 77-13-4]|uniref:Uncharacterized protein n=1 Tax=Fusarium vanettenii (strain ATCC MYA-4622 / CBS 123669 / FGSC 9596 / NRRL 45880 / 77-13-4) TaxID=660122 RepID=C7ZJZ2_FUSV7|nr:uncharacterized protein NECHADRAFT_87986 [Fusarium vanettenii 77-13-4]EEU35676.1 predicted protein [Fusarium vanettenii 77-13-4]